MLGLLNVLFDVVLSHLEEPNDFFAMIKTCRKWYAMRKKLVKFFEFKFDSNICNLFLHQDYCPRKLVCHDDYRVHHSVNTWQIHRLTVYYPRSFIQMNEMQTVKELNVIGGYVLSNLPPNLQRLQASCCVLASSITVESLVYKCPWVCRGSVANSSATFPNLIEATFQSFCNLPNLSHSTRLQKLCLTNTLNYDIPNIDFFLLQLVVSTLHCLRFLRFDCLQEMWVLRNLVDLTHFECENGNFADLDGLKTLKNLQCVIIRSTPSLRDITGLLPLASHLTHLDLQDCNNIIEKDLTIKQLINLR